ncbi:RNA recognition motif family protein [Reticulomyxa filosa]|uniref:RNA recognition motif family protein n=1 Tax=Reticulomyxa filosa TaxID=46433 RepID=X6NZ55_RETFI|nr:RNA recognition motif family protein [Reticulomyxa filosa]|eukprot:ETO31590.1 RNA recognition motif family protein [Reticulomyxa filosa]
MDRHLWNEQCNTSDDNRYIPDLESVLEVYVRNISYQAHEEDIRKYFSQCGKIEKITLPRDSVNGKLKGFCFIKFSNNEEKKSKSINTFYFLCLSRQVEVRRNKGKISTKRSVNNENCNTTNGNTKEVKAIHFLEEQYESLTKESNKISQGLKPCNCRTIYVGNVPFETMEQDIRKMFHDCGEIAAVRIVRQKFSQLSRG